MLEPPFFPDRPIKPDRKKIIALGIFAGLAFAFAFVALLETIDKRVRGAESLTSLINMRPLVVIPYITTKAELKRKKNFKKYLVISVFVSISLILLIIHFLVMPLDLLMVKLMARFA